VNGSTPETAREFLAIHAPEFEDRHVRATGLFGILVANFA
jgi:hypothetical protein